LGHTRHFRHRAHFGARRGRQWFGDADDDPNHDPYADDDHDIERQPDLYDDVQLLVDAYLVVERDPARHPERGAR
jgi:hypothetical protein